LQADEYDQGQPASKKLNVRQPSVELPHFLLTAYRLDRCLRIVPTHPICLTLLMMTTRRTSRTTRVQRILGLLTLVPTNLMVRVSKAAYIRVNNY
jgi:hypothetical protein